MRSFKSRLHPFSLFHLLAPVLLWYEEPTSPEKQASSVFFYKMNSAWFDYRACLSVRLCLRWSETTAAPTTWLWVTTWPAGKRSTCLLWLWKCWLFTGLTSCCLTSGSTPRWWRQFWFRWWPGCPRPSFICSSKQVKLWMLNHDQCSVFLPSCYFYGLADVSL